MGISNDINSNSINPTTFQDNMCTRKVGQNNRRALGIINQNMTVEGRYPCVVNKRALSEKQEIGEKKQADPVHRPITRRFAAQIASTKQSGVEETKKSNLGVSNSNEFGQFIFIDDDDNDDEPKSTEDQPVPMSPEQTEAMHGEPDQMEEVEMEDIYEELHLDIDSSDANNPLAVVDYIEDLYVHYRKIESGGCVSPNYMAKQCDINEKMRAILIDWLIEVHDKFDLLPETLFLTVNLIDRFLEKQTVVRKKLQLVGLVAMLLACKYEEVSVPVVGDLILISDKAYSRKEVLEMLELLAFFLVELSLVEYEMLKFPPSMLAAAAVYTAQCTVYCVKQWSKTCEWHTNYSEDQLLECSSLMVDFHKKAGSGKLTGVHRKYCSSKFSYTAKNAPASFLLENNPL
ncbi:PREDICTED: G2/mitotic-specific cyclin-1-like isoform X2 [Lupinus angustifolius]|uniref:G2/mitotic-specific cyclin-1-like isoform X2 n=1 Tax=Lupinus angustifolius TaxID=3871 RepID=UPI00092FB13E|nr:PREDICTED: G2/mitotic-specific cyclin-1-like isoform X2 [Lupinus angustifolius]